MSRARAEEYQEAPIKQAAEEAALHVARVMQLRTAVAIGGVVVPAGARLVLCQDAPDGVHRCWFNGQRIDVDAVEVSE